jgi:5-aminopentanamidase
VKIAAYQAPLIATRGFDAVGLIRARVAQCEAEGIAFLCCPEAILGGLADYLEPPDRFGLRCDNAELASVLAPLASDTVTTIVGFSELTSKGCLYNSAAVVHRGALIGVYRKLHPALNRSVYKGGCELPVFRVGTLTFGIILCNDSNFPEPAQRVAAHGATVLFVPTNNGLPRTRAHAQVAAEAIKVDRARARENRLWIIRADVAGHAGELTSHGCSAIVSPDGRVAQSARPFSEDFLVANVDAAQS